MIWLTRLAALPKSLLDALGVTLKVAALALVLGLFAVAGCVAGCAM